VPAEVSALFVHATAAIVAVIRLPGSNHPLFHFWLPFGFLGSISWSVWLLRRTLTGLYRPTANDHWEEATVVAPAFREDPAILRAAVRSWGAGGAAEIVLVMPTDEEKNRAFAEAMFADQPSVRILTNDDPDKRMMLDVGIRAATRDIVVLSDSDTVWEAELLPRLVMPFADPAVGGVGSRQRVVGMETSLWRRAAEWMLDAKYLAYLPAMSRRGAVSCLSGRTVAYRREALLPIIPELVDEQFLGRRCISGDDGRLTWLVLNQGYKTVYQQNAVAWTMMPDGARAFLTQRLRWSRNSWRCYLRAIFRGWLFHQPLITRLSVLQMLLSPMSLTIGFIFVGLAAARQDYAAVAIWLLWINCGRGIRAFDHLFRNPRNLLILPVMSVLILFVMTAIKYFAFFTMNRQAWMTRTEDRSVAMGQGLETLEQAAEFGVLS
jgi:N-acetylglucosaminyltransferase